MRILQLSAYHDPEIAASLYIFNNIRDACVEAGHEVIVSTPMPTRGISAEVRSEYKNKKIEQKFGGQLTIYRYPLIREGKNPVIRAFRYLSGNIAQFFIGLSIPDVDMIIISSTPPTQGALAAFLKKIKKVPVIYFLQDIFPDSLVNAGLTRTDSLLWKIGRGMENYIYRNMDKIIVVSEDLKQNIMAKGVPGDKIEVIYNWADEEDVYSVERSENPLFDRYGLDRNKFYITYCGNIGFSQNMDMLIEAAKDLEKLDDLVFILIGEGAYKENVEDLILKKQVNNVIMLPFQPYEDIMHVFSLGDVGLIISKPGIGQNSVPSKTWSIMSAERPILASFDINSELSTIISKADCGLCVQAGEKEALKQAILELYNNRTAAQALGRKGRRFVMENLTREMGTSKYVGIISQFG